MASGQSDSLIESVLRLAFGRPIRWQAVPASTGTGERDQVYLLDDPQAPPCVLLRRYPAQRAGEALRAFHALRGLQPYEFPSPDVYYLGWNQNCGESLLLVQHRLEARGFQGEPQQFFNHIAPGFAEALAELHDIPWRNMPPLGETPLVYAFQELTALVRRIDAPPLVPIWDWLALRVARIKEMPLTVIHGDYSPRHILAYNGEILGVLGWDQAVIADARLDVGYASAALGVYGAALSDRFIELYTGAAGVLPDLVFWEVFSALRMLAQVARTLSRLPPLKRERFLRQPVPQWAGLLRFVEDRTGLRLL